MIWPPPSSTRTEQPFPYTTLFRSLIARKASKLLSHHLRRVGQHDTAVRRLARPRLDPCRVRMRCRDHVARAVARPAGDAHHLLGSRAIGLHRDPGERVFGCGTSTRRMHRGRSEEHTSELQSLMRISYAVFCLKKKTTTST